MPPFLSVIGLQSKSQPGSTSALPNFRVRNLTGSPLQLTLLERYRAVPSGSTGLFSFNISTSTPTSPHIAQHVGTFVRRALDLELAPFTISNTDVLPPRSKDGEIVRLTFSIDGQKYRMECPSKPHLSQPLHALVADPKYHFTGVFLPESTFVCIYNSASLDSWMQYLHDATPLSALSIPGTHNSPACYNALPSVRCQIVPPTSQLQNGVRFLDIRVQPESTTSARLILVHSVFPVSLTGTRYFHNLESDLIAFLDAHPSETVLVSIKREGTGSWEGTELAEALQKHHFSTPAPHAARWHTSSSIPNLGAVRGKIVLLRRYPLAAAHDAAHDGGGPGVGIDASDWADNSAHSAHENVCVQDFYEVLSTASVSLKLRYIGEHLERAGAAVAALPGITTDRENPVPCQPLFVNFASASNFWKRGCWPERVARLVNPEVVRWVAERHHVDVRGTEGNGKDEVENGMGVVREKVGDGGTGIVVCDWVGANGDWDLVRCIVGCNTRLMVREMELAE